MATTEAITDLIDRAAAAYAAQQAVQKEAEREREREAAERRSAEYALLRAAALTTFGIDHDWATGPLVVGGRSLIATHIYHTAGLLEQYQCADCGRDDDETRDSYYAIRSLEQLGSLLQAAPSIWRCWDCRSGGASTHPDEDAEAPPQPTAAERLVGALVDLLAEHGHSLAERTNARLDALRREVQAAQDRARDAEYAADETKRLATGRRPPRLVSGTQY